MRLRATSWDCTTNGLRRCVSKRGALIAAIVVVLAACSPGPPSPTTTAQGPCAVTAPSFNPADFHPCWLAANVNAGTAVPGETLKIEGDLDVGAYLDPQGEYTPSSAIVERAYTRQLVSYPASTNRVTAQTIVPDAAAAMPTISDGGLVYTFHIKAGVMWNTSPARQVTSQDFERGIERTCDPTLFNYGNPGYYTATILGLEAFCAPFAAMDPNSSAAVRAAYINTHGSDVSGIQTPDSSTIVFTLTHPALDFLNILALAFASAAPVEDLSYVPVTPHNPVYSDGPYQISNYVVSKDGIGQEIDLDHNPAWSQSSDTLRHDYVTSTDIKLNMSGSGVPAEVQSDLTNGKADLALDTAVPVGNLPVLTSPWNPQLGVFPQMGTSDPFVTFNMLSPNNNGALGKVQVRQALEYAIDKVAISTLFGGSSFTQPLNQVLGPGAEGYAPFDDYPTHDDEGDPRTCKTMLAAAGYKNGISLTYLYMSDLIIANQEFEDVKSDFLKCGVILKPKPIKGADFFGPLGLGETVDLLKSGTWDLTDNGWIPDWIGQSNGRAILPDLFDGRENFPGIDAGDYDNPVVDTLINEAETATSLKAASNLWHQADERVMADAPFIPIQTTVTPLFRSARVHNAIYSDFSLSYDITQVWLSP